MQLSDLELDAMLANIKQQLGEKDLATQLEMIIKHLPTYTKIIKTHIEQLKHVLASDQHQNKNLENINLSPTVRQLMSIFEQLQERDLEDLEELFLTAKKWAPQSTTSTQVTAMEI